MRLLSDFPAQRLVWASGGADKPAETHRITAGTGEGAVKEVTFERPDGDKTARFVLFLSPNALRLTKEEVSASGDVAFRNRYQFTRPDA